MQENSRTYETLEGIYQIASGPQKTDRMTPQQRQAQFGNPWYIDLTTAGGSNTIPTRPHPELGQSRRARIDYNSAQRATLAKQEYLLHRHSNRDCRKVVEGVEEHTRLERTPRTICFQ